MKHIVQAHGGEVSLESELGAGTTFFFTMPPDDQRASSLRVQPRVENGGSVPDVKQLA